jgi:hypothetical protein
MRAVPGLDDDRIREHVTQYESYLELQDTKKILLQKYKESKKKNL